MSVTTIDPKAGAERLAQHLAANYGLHLDACRRGALVEEIASFFPVVEVDIPDAAPAPVDSTKTRKPRAKKEKQ